MEDIESTWCDLSEVGRVKVMTVVSPYVSICGNVTSRRSHAMESTKEEGDELKEYSEEPEEIKIEPSVEDVAQHKKPQLTHATILPTSEFRNRKEFGIELKSLSSTWMPPYPSTASITGTPKSLMEMVRKFSISPN